MKIGDNRKLRTRTEITIKKKKERKETIITQLNNNIQHITDGVSVSENFIKR